MSDMTNTEANGIIAVWMDPTWCGHRWNLWDYWGYGTHTEGAVCATCEEVHFGAYPPINPPPAYCTDWNALMRALDRLCNEGTWKLGIAMMRLLDDDEGNMESSDLTVFWLCLLGCQATAHALARAIQAQKEARNA